MRAFMRVASVSLVEMADKWFSSAVGTCLAILVIVIRCLASTSVISVTSTCSKTEA